MLENESIEERQENEIDAIKAIFAPFVQDLREQDAWKVRRPPEIQIRLFPQESMQGKEAHVELTLAVKCGDRYPFAVPQLQLINPRGLSDANIKKLLKDLELKAETMKGQEMIYPLAETVQGFLYSNNKPADKSFYDQMLMKQRTASEKLAAEEKQRRELMQKQKDYEIAQIEQEIEKRKSYMLQEEKNVRFKLDNDVSEEDSAEPVTVTPPSSSPTKSSPRDKPHFPAPQRSKSVESDIQSNLSHKKESFELELRSGRKKRLQIIRSLEREVNGAFTHYALDLDRDNALVVVCEWLFRWRPGRRKPSAQQLEILVEESKKYLKQLDVMDGEFQSLVRLKHPGLRHYLGWIYGFDKDHVFVHVLKEHVYGTPLSAFLKDNAPFSVDQGRLLAVQLLDTLNFLHKNNVVHRHLIPSSVIYADNGKYLLGDYSIEKKLEEMHQYSLKETGDMVSTIKSGKKADILQLGMMLASVFVGSYIVQEISDVPFAVPNEAKEFLSRCLVQFDKDRWSVEQLQNHRFITQRPAVAEKTEKLVPSECEKGFFKNLGPESPDRENSDLASLLAKRSLAVPAESRLNREFEIIQFCGSGGYGDVLKVKNVLDGRTYAIKRIPLKETKEKLNQRILREVKLLSRLNHENVVRYYNSWAETIAVTSNGTREASLLTTDSASKNGKGPVKTPEGFVNSFGFLPDDIEQNAPPPQDGSVEWSGDDLGHISPHFANDDSANDDQDFFGPSYPQNKRLSSDTSSDRILFGNDGDPRNEEPSSDSKDTTTKTDGHIITASSQPSTASLPTTVLFIQMEYCDKSTLRTCIDEGLYKDQSRVWRLFREILEGLAHIHQQGIIHRDLKPANIFIDSEDHARIGDFGLATHRLMSGGNAMDSLAEFSLTGTDTMATDEASRTGRVGTALYVAPELVENVAKATYSQKVDVYSLGVSFFEMSYRPLPTGMERTKVLQNIRKSPAQFPQDFDFVGLKQQATLLVWLLEHDVQKRPHTVDVLQSDLMPPIQIEEAEVNEIIRHTVQNPQSKAYKRLMQALFTQQMGAVNNLTYDSDLHKGTGNMKWILAFEFVERKVTQILQLHGASRFQTPLLMPKSDHLTAPESVRLVDLSGDVLVLPHDLRIPFARYVAHNGIVSTKRFCIDRVYRDRHINAAHPKELYECAFDIVTSFPESFLADAECVSVISDIIAELPSLADRSYHLRLNHTDFLRAAFLHAGLPENKLDMALNRLWDTRYEKVGKQKTRLRWHDIHEISEHSHTFLEKFLEQEGVLGQISELVKIIIRRRGTAGALAKKALFECETFLGILEKTGCPFKVDICLGLSDKYIRSGLMYHVVQRIPCGDKPLGTLAVGGRYSSLILSFDKKNSVDFRPVAVGVSMAFDKLVNAVAKSDEFELKSAVDILICAVGSSAMLKEQIAVLRSLRAQGIRADILMDPHPVLEDTQDFCRKMGIHLVIIKDSFCTVRFTEREKMTERKLPLSELTDWIGQKMSSVRTETAESASMSVENVAPPAQALPGTRVKITFITPEKMHGRDKKRYSTHILAVLEQTVTSFSSQTILEILALDLPGSVLKWLPAYMTRSGNGTIRLDDWSQLCDKFPKHRKYFKQIQDDLQDQPFDNKVRLIVFSMSDDIYRFLI